MIGTHTGPLGVQTDQEQQQDVRKIQSSGTLSLHGVVMPARSSWLLQQCLCRVENFPDGPHSPEKLPRQLFYNSPVKGHILL